MKIRSIVVDDEPLARSLIEGYVKQTPYLEFAGSYPNAIEAMERVGKGDVDLIFLDIQMPQLNGMELSRVVGQSVKIIFITAFEQYAIEGYKVEALDYLLKPVSYIDFLKSSGKAKRWFEKEGYADSIFVKSDYKLVRIDIDNILYVEADKDYVHFILESGGEVMSLMSLKSAQLTLPSDKFVRVHKSFIVNIEKIKTIEKNRIVFNKILIPISESYKESFNHIFEIKNRIQR